MLLYFIEIRFNVAFMHFWGRKPRVDATRDHVEVEKISHLLLYPCLSDYLQVTYSVVDNLLSVTRAHAHIASKVNNITWSTQVYRMVMSLKGDHTQLTNSGMRGRLIWALHAQNVALWGTNLDIKWMIIIWEEKLCHGDTHLFQENQPEAIKTAVDYNNII